VPRLAVLGDHPLVGVGVLAGSFFLVSLLARGASSRLKSGPIVYVNCLG
jgi:hypothetical protein